MMRTRRIALKTTIVIADETFRRIKALAAQKGQTLKAFLNDALREKLESDEAQARRSRGWRAVFGKAPGGSLDRVQEIIDAEFSRVRIEDWP